MYRTRFFASALALVAGIPGVLACNPTKSTCPPIPGFTQDYSVDFTQITSLPSDWILASGSTVNLGSNGAEFAWRKKGDAPYIWTNQYMWYGTAEVVMKVANGTGVISSAVLYADDLDEIDWEWSGNNFNMGGNRVSTNYFGKGITGSYDRATVPKVDFSPISGFHTYTLDWSPDQLTWKIDGSVVRTLLASSTDNGEHQYPQTPSRFHLGLWDAGDPSGYPGTAYWAGGWTDQNKGPYIAYVKSVSIHNMNPGPYYKFSDKTGSGNSVKIVDTPGTTASKTMASTATSAAPATGTLSSLDFVPQAGDSPPSPTQSPVATDCNRWYLHNKTEGCADIAAGHNIVLSEFLAWNPAVGSQCYNLWFNYWTCVGVGDIGKTGSSTGIATSTDTASAEPSDNAPANGQGNAMPTAYSTTSDAASTTDTVSAGSAASTTASASGDTTTLPASGSTSDAPMKTTSVADVPTASVNTASGGSSGSSAATSSTFTPLASGSSSRAISTTSSGVAATMTGPLSCPSSNGAKYTATDGSTYSVECFVDRPYGDLQSYSLSSFTACVDQCASTGSSCGGVVWAPATGTATTGTCYVKNVLQMGNANTARWGAKRLTGAVSSLASKPTASATTISTSAAASVSLASGPASCPAGNGLFFAASNNPTSSSYKVECGQDRPYGDLKSQSAPSLQACLDTCEATAGCNNCAWSSKAQLCYLKKALTGTVLNRVIYGAVRQGGAAAGTASMPKFDSTTASTASGAMTTVPSSSTLVPSTSNAGATSANPLPLSSTPSGALTTAASSTSLASSSSSAGSTSSPPSPSSSTSVTNAVVSSNSSPSTAATSASSSIASATSGSSSPPPSTTSQSSPSCPAPSGTLFQNASSPYNYKADCFTNHPGNDLLSLTKQNFTSCIAACDPVAKCVAVVFRVSDGACWVKGALQFTNADNALWGAIRQPVKTTSITTSAGTSGVAKPVATTSASSTQNAKRAVRRGIRGRRPNGMV